MESVPKHSGNSLTVEIAATIFSTSSFAGVRQCRLTIFSYLIFDMLARSLLSEENAEKLTASITNSDWTSA